MTRAKSYPLWGALISAGLILSAGRAVALDDPAGYWATEKHESQIKVTHCGADAICGTIFWMKDPNDAKGHLKLDRENEDEAKRKRSLLGLPLINMKVDEDHWSGSVYNPQNGKTYDATFKLLSHGEAEIKGCVAYVLCGGQKWTREEPRQTGTAASLTSTAATAGTKSAKPAASPAPAE